MHDHTAELATLETAPPTADPMAARLDAVACLTKSAYERASTLETTQEEREALTADFPDDAFRKGAAGKDNLIYIEHAYLRERLTKVLGVGQCVLIPRDRWTKEFQTAKGKQGVRVYVEAMLIVRGCFVAEAIGDMDYYPDNDATNFGDAVEGAKSAALRRCAKELCVGLQAWKKSWCEGWWTRRGETPPQGNAPSGSPIAGKPCPKCGKPLLRSKFPPRDNPTAEPGWYCYDKKGGCGAELSFDFAEPKATPKADPPANGKKAKPGETTLREQQANALCKQMADAKTLDELRALSKSQPPLWWGIKDEHSAKGQEVFSARKEFLTAQEPAPEPIPGAPPTSDAVKFFTDFLAKQPSLVEINAAVKEAENEVEQNERPIVLSMIADYAGKNKWKFSAIHGKYA